MTSILLFHGLGDDRGAWTGVADQLREEAMIYTFDFPGFGSRANVSVSSIQEVVKDAHKAVIQQAASEPAVLIGHSLGGVVVTLLAEELPDMVAGVINVEGNLTSADCFISRQAATSPDFPGWFEEFVASASRRYQSALERCNRETFLSLATDLVRFSDAGDLARRFAGLKARILYCIGSDDLPEESRNALKSHRIPTMDFPGAGHWIMDSQPDALVNTIQTFVRSLESETIF